MSVIKAFLKESIQSALSQRIVSIVTILMIAGMCAAVLLTTGRTAGAEKEVIDSIDSAGTKTVVFRFEQSSGVDSSAIDRIERVGGIFTVFGLSSAFDVTNSSIAEGEKVPARLAYGKNLELFGIQHEQAFPNITGFLSLNASNELGLSDSVGSVSAVTGEEFYISGVIQTPGYLSFLEPVLLIPRTQTVPEPLSMIIVVAEHSEDVASLPAVIVPLFDLTDPSKMTVETSEEFAELRALVEGQLGNFGRELVLVIFLLTAGLVAVILYSFVLLKRKDFGRRRALGASRVLIVSLLVTQTAILSIIGALGGLAIATALLLLGGSPLPSFQFFLALALLAIITGVMSALFPAWFASRRDPIRELRVP